MYIGSIRFYKHLILFALALMIAVPIGTSLVLLHSNRLYKDRISNLETQILQIKDTQPVKAQTVAKAADPAPEEDKDAPGEKKEDFPYQSMYPNLYAKAPEEQVRKDGTVYLTFDDGPSERTLEILSILDLFDVKATFFVVGKPDQESRAVMKKIVDSGHSIGLHTYSHNYTQIYSSVESFLDDFNQIYELVYESTGVKPDIFRFAGGSVNSYNSVLYMPLIAEMTRRGFTFYDWNACNDDATAKNLSKQKLIKEATSNLDPDRRYILLMHDSAPMKATVEALPEIITKLKDKGFSFDKLTSGVKPICFAYPD